MKKNGTVITRIDAWSWPEHDTRIFWYAEGWEKDMNSRACYITESDWDLDQIAAWLQDNGWKHIRRWPGGLRAWLDELHPIRTASEIKSKREQMRRFPDPAIQAHTIDLAWDM